MHPTLEQILALIETAPLSPTGKNDIRHTIRTEYQPPYQPNPQVETKPVRYSPQSFQPTCACAAGHRHSRMRREVQCFDCGCAYTEYETYRPRVTLTLEMGE